MEGIEKITGRIQSDTKVEIDQLLADATVRAAEITSKYDQRAKAEGAALLEKGKLAAQQREERLGSVAQLEARKLILGAKQEMVGKAFDLTLQKLTSLPDETYIALLADLVVAAARTGREQVLFSRKDRTRVGKAVVSRANDMLARKVAPKLPDELTDSKAGAFLDKVFTGASALLAGTGMLTIAEESRPIAGGVILKDDKVETNCSFEVLIHLQRDSLANEVAKLLFTE